MNTEKKDGYVWTERDQFDEDLICPNDECQHPNEPDVLRCVECETLLIEDEKDDEFAENVSDTGHVRHKEAEAIVNIKILSSWQNVLAWYERIIWSTIDAVVFWGSLYIVVRYMTYLWESNLDMFSTILGLLILTFGGYFSVVLLTSLNDKIA